MKNFFTSVFFWFLASLSCGALGASSAVELYNKLHEATPQLSEGYVNVEGRRYHYVTAGEGPLVILYHGFPSFWYVWKNQIADLSHSFRVVAIDGLGSHLTSRPEGLGSYSIASLAADLNRFAYELGGDSPFTLVGHDWGGALAWAFAQGYPERLERLIVFSAPPYNLFLDLLRENEEQKSKSFYVDVLKAPFVDDLLAVSGGYPIWKMAYGPAVEDHYLTVEEGELFRSALGEPGAVDGGINWYRANIPDHDRIDVSDYWPPSNPVIKTPSLLVWGGADRTFTADFLDLMPSYASQFTLEVIPEAGHKPGLSHSLEVNRLVRRFLCDSEC